VTNHTLPHLIKCIKLFPCVQVTSHFQCIRLVTVRSSLPCININLRIAKTDIIIFIHFIKGWFVQVHFINPLLIPNLKVKPKYNINSRQYFFFQSKPLLSRRPNNTNIHKKKVTKNAFRKVCKTLERKPKESRKNGELNFFQSAKILFPHKTQHRVP